MSRYLDLVRHLRDDAKFRAALQSSSTPEARLTVLRDAGLEPPTADDLLENVSGGNCVPCFKQDACRT